jgi:hypothetical protein
MNFRKIFVPIAGVVLVIAAYRGYGWPGVTLVAGGIVMWVLLNFTRMVKVLERARQNPIGHVGSAVMLNAKLKPGATLLHVIAMTRSLGAQQSPKDTQPEIYRWTDGTDSHVTCEFMNGKLQRWELVRPAAPAATADATSDAAPDVSGGTGAGTPPAP